MASVNRVTLIGNLGKDPEVRYTQGGDAVCNFSMATSERWKDKQGELQEKTEWHRITAFQRAAEVLGEHAKKGSSLYIEGKLSTRKYEKDGVEKYTTEIIVDRFQFLGDKKRDDGDEAPQRTSKPAAGKAKNTDDFDDDIPF